MHDYFAENPITSKTTEAIYKTCNTDPAQIVLNFDNLFYQSNYDLINSKIVEFKNQGLVVFLILDGVLSGEADIQCFDTVFCDLNCIPRTDIVVKFKMFSRIRSKSNAFTCNVNVKKISKNDCYYINKPDRFTNEYNEFDLLLGAQYLPCRVLKEILDDDSFDSVTSLQKNIREKLHCKDIINMPILAVMIQLEELNERLVFSLLKPYKKSDLIKELVKENLNIAAIIPFKDQVELTVQCVEQLKKYIPIDDIYLVNNQSLDSSVSAVQEHSVNIVDANIHYNYSLINNIGFEQLGAENYEYILLLNNDVIVCEKTIAALGLQFENKPDVGAVGCRLLYPNGNIQFGGVGLSHSRRSNFHGWYHIDQPHSLSDDQISNYNFEAHSLTAACMLIRRSVFEEIGGFDYLNYPIGFSDADLCMRIRQLGYKLIYTSRSQSIHYESVSRGYGYPDDLEGILLDLSCVENLTLEIVKGY